MSVRAYILREKMIWVNEDAGFFQYDNNGENLTKYVHEDLEYVINIWHQDKLVDEMFKFGAEDYTNHDFIGEIEMGKENFYSMINNSDLEFTDDDWDSIEDIRKYFKEGNDWLILKCY